MKKYVKNLTKAVIKGDDRFHVREDLNFHDDGNNFKGFDYKGLPITTLRSAGMTYLCVRVDYLTDNSFTWYDWRDTPEYALADEFNGIEEIDMETLVDNCEKILSKVDELNRIAETEIIDMTAVKNRLRYEQSLLEDALEDAKKITWWELNQWEMWSIRDAIAGIKRDIDRITNMLEELDLDTMTKKKRRETAQHFEEYGYIVERGEGFWISTIKEKM